MPRWFWRSPARNVHNVGTLIQVWRSHFLIVNYIKKLLITRSESFKRSSLNSRTNNGSIVKVFVRQKIIHLFVIPCIQFHSRLSKCLKRCQRNKFIVQSKMRTLNVTDMFNNWPKRRKIYRLDNEQAFLFRSPSYGVSTCLKPLLKLRMIFRQRPSHFHAFMRYKWVENAS